MKRKTILGLVAATAIGLAGCSPTADTPEPSAQSESAQSEVAAAPARTIETEFGTVELPEGDASDWKVVALGWSDAEAALAAGIKPVAVYDWMSFGEENKGVGPWATELFGDVDPVVFPNIDATVDYEAVASLEPDLILNVRSSGDEEQYEKLASIAPTVSGPEGAAPYAVEWPTHLTMIADSLGRAEQGQSALAEAEETISAVRADNPEFAGFTAVVGTKFGDAYGAYLPGDTRWDLLSDVGFILYPPVEDLESMGYYAPVSTEQVSVFDANVAVFFPIGYTLEEMEDDPLISSLAVVQDGRAVMLSETSEEAQAFSAMSVLSVPLALEALAPQLQDAVGRAQ